MRDVIHILYRISNKQYACSFTYFTVRDSLSYMTYGYNFDIDKKAAKRIDTALLILMETGKKIMELHSF